MLVAIVSLLLVILFVLLLHLYTHWFLVQACRRSRSSVTVPHVLGSRFHHRFTIIDTSDTVNSSIKLGLPLSIISSLSLFVYKFSLEEGRDYRLECPTCLSIDMWLNSHSTCLICRGAIHNNHSHKIDQLEIEIADQGHASDGLTISIEEELRSEIVMIVGDQISEPHESANVMVEKDSRVSGSSSSPVGESIKKLINSCSSCNNRSGGEIESGIN